MRDRGVHIVVSGAQLEAREPCVWGESRAVERGDELGRVPAVIHIDADLGARLYCEDCWGVAAR